jgi:starvation-inducible DNA-binding protein
MKELIESLFIVLADISTLVVKSRNFHWNVSGTNFYHLHLLFERIYSNLVDDPDELAEHTRYYNYSIPATQKAFISLSNIKELEIIPEPYNMATILAKDFLILRDDLNKANEIATKLNLQSTVNLISGLLQKYQSLAYLLASQSGQI